MKFVGLKSLTVKNGLAMYVERYIALIVKAVQLDFVLAVKMIDYKR